jgi:hypothetical protein
MESVSLKATGKAIADGSRITIAGTATTTGTSGAVTVIGTTMIATIVTGITMGIAIAADL